MIQIAVLDHSAEARAQIIDSLHGFLSNAGTDLLLLPRIQFKPISAQELRFNSAPDLLIIGSEFVARDLSEVPKIKMSFPKTAVLLWLNKDQSNLVVVEQAARYGVDDVLFSDTTADYFFRRLLILVKKAVHHNSGKLVLVDGGKGGLGVTTLVAALGELIGSTGAKVTLIDLDFETQDLSRFLQARPFVNDNLRLLLDEERPVTEESVAQCLNLIWQDQDNIKCMSPVLESDDLYDPRSNVTKIILSVIEVLDSINDVVIVDMGCARSALRKLFYRIADNLVFVVNDDPASLYASVDKLSKGRNLLGAGAQICVVENNIGLRGLGNKLLRQEFSRAARLENEHWADTSISFCKIGQRWPGSGSSFYSQAKNIASKQIESLAQSLSLLQITERRNIFNDFLERFSNFAGTKVASARLKAEDSNLSDARASDFMIKPELVSAESKPQIAQSNTQNVPALAKESWKMEELISKPRSRAATFG
jgi:MinD-like ATPase involved in chromosome partitioning or flagellar assembly